MKKIIIRCTECYEEMIGNIGDRCDNCKGETELVMIIDNDDDIIRTETTKTTKTTDNDTTKKIEIDFSMSYDRWSNKKNI